MPHRLRAIFDSAVDFAIIATDRDGIVTNWNRGAEQILHWSAAEMEGRSAARFFTPEDRAIGRPQTEMRLALEHGRAADERWHMRKDGSRFWASGELMPLRNEQGEHLGYLKMLRDRTKEHRSAEALQAVETSLRRAQEAGGVGLFAVSIADDVLYPTPEFCRLFGLPVRESYPAHQVEACILPEDLGTRSSDREARRRGESPTDTEYRIRKADTGEIRWIARRAEIERDAAGAPARFVGAVRDITDGRRTEERLRELNESLEARVAERTAERDRVWQVSRDMLGVADKNGVWLSINPAWSRILAWEASEIIGRTSEWMEHVEDRAETRAEVERLAAGEATPSFENRFRTKDGSYRDLSWTAVPEGDFIYAVARDVTEEKERLAQLGAAQEQLRQAQKMEAVGQLTGGLAHDFNNLLAGISGSLELMGTRLSQGRLADVERYMTAAQGAARRAAALTHRLLAFSRRQTLDPKPTDVNRLIAGMEELIRRTVGPAIAVEVVGAAGLWTTLVDPHQLENALLNLCINARDAMPEGGRITIETANKWLDRWAARSHDIPEGQYLSLCVTDTGTGMAPEVVARAFDPFFTTKPMGEGTGLGLSMIYGFAKQSGGQVRIYSEVGDGTTVCIYLPRHLGEASVESVEGQVEARARSEQGETVLVVDDEPTVRMLVTDVLEELGYRAIEAGDSAEGLKILRSDVRIDLLVTDVGLPGGMNGRQMADAARQTRPDLKVLFITGYAENALIGNGQLGPGLHVVTKPFNLDALTARIRELIAAG